MKLKLLFLSALLIGTLASFTLVKTGATGGVKVQLQLPAGVKPGVMEYTPVGISKTREDVENGEYIKEIFADEKGIADFGQMEAGTYYIDGYTEDETTSIGYFGIMEIQVVAGKANVFTFKLEVDAEEDSEEE